MTKADERREAARLAGRVPARDSMTETASRDNLGGHEDRRPLRIVVVGGVAAGAGAATKARRTDEDADILLLERGPYVSFANCGLPYYVSGEIEELRDLLLMTPQDFTKRFRIQVRLRSEVVRIDREGRRVEVVDLATGEHSWERYDRLILATGGAPVVPPIDGIRRPGVFTLTTVPDAVGLRAWTARAEVRQAVVVGAGFIGLEAVEALLRLDLETHLVEMLPQVLPPFDPELARPLATHLEEQHARLHLGQQVVRFVGSGETGALEAVELASGETIPAQVAIVSIGVRPELSLPREAGLAIGPAGGVVVDERMRTSDPAIYAAGDIVEVPNRVTGRMARLPLAGPANKEGRVAGSNAAGGNLTFPGVVGTSIVRVCELAAGMTGLSEREARRAGLDPILAYVHPNDHAGYYPGATPVSIKLVADRATGKLLGAQVIGRHGVDKRIDVLATALYAGLTVEDLEGLDLAYSPPFGSAKDPVIQAGFVAANQYRGEVDGISVTELARQMTSEAAPTMLDVRDPSEYKSGHIPGAHLAPLDDLRGSVDRLRELLGPTETARPVVVYCGVGYRSYHATKILVSLGYRALNLGGGFTSWEAAYPERVEVSPRPLRSGS
jgi:NADPH-dependent 2,4-dienoyl-CoA reductase/sulfur reductase-like enzyme/rhodanese-related sulfurtransferase